MKNKTKGIIAALAGVCIVGSFIPATEETASTNEVTSVPTTSIVVVVDSSETTTVTDTTTTSTSTSTTTAKLDSVKEYSGKASVVLNNNKPNFSKSDYTTTSFEKYSKLDSLGRCGVCHACIGKDLMPTEERGEIGQIKPTGWHTIRYDDLISDKYLYNRCHLIGYQLTGENANERNLITGTRYLNVTGMLPYENSVADYIEETGNHVLYRVTPDFRGKELVAHGVQIEGYSVEDKGKGICFNVYCYNVQPGIVIDYATGDSHRENEAATTTAKKQTTKNSDGKEYTYILNTNTKKFHYSTCSAVKQMKDKNKKESNKSRDQIIAEGYSPCGICNP